MTEGVWSRAEDLPGCLIIVEGIDGSGKTTQLDLLHKWLRSQGYLVVFTEWNSSPVVKGTTRRGKRHRLLTPMSFSLIHAADFASRTHTQILPALRAGAVVLADRYVYTAFARDGARGVSPAWLRQLYSFAIEPTVALYFAVPLDEALQRIMRSRLTLKYYEAGLDLGLDDDPSKSFRIFQTLLLEEYERLLGEYDLIRLDATETVVRQQQRVRDIVEPHLEGVRRIDGGDLHAALAEAGLQGRYVTGGASTGAGP